MKLSIITVTFNSSNYLNCCIQSVLSQSYSDIEYVIIDGGSTDGTIEIVKSYGKRISKFISEPDKGIYDAMNKGILCATGDIIGILNSDDIYADENVIANVVDQFIQNENLDICFGDLVYVNAKDTSKVVRNWKSKPYYKRYFEDGNVPAHPTLFLKNDVYKAVGLFDLQYKLAADYEFMLRLFKKFNFESKYFNRLIVKMRLGGATNKSLVNIISGNKEIINAWLNNGLKPPVLLMPLKIFKRLIQFS